jgi:hypothetical protein
MPLPPKKLMVLVKPTTLPHRSVVTMLLVCSSGGSGRAGAGLPQPW